MVSVTPARIADSRAGLQIPGAVGAVPVQVTWPRASPGLTDITAIAGGSETGYAITH